MAVMEKKPTTRWSKDFRRLRKAKGISQEAAAEHLEVPVTTIRGWEQSRHVPPAYVQKFILRLLAQHSG